LGFNKKIGEIQYAAFKLIGNYYYGCLDRNTSLFYTKKQKKNYSDEKLHEIALSRGMHPIQKEYDKFLKLLDSKDNPITKEKVALGKKLYFDTLLSKDRNRRL